MNGQNNQSRISFTIPLVVSMVSTIIIVLIYIYARKNKRISLEQETNEHAVYENAPNNDDYENGNDNSIVNDYLEPTIRNNQVKTNMFDNEYDKPEYSEIEEQYTNTLYDQASNTEDIHKNNIYTLGNNTPQLNNPVYELSNNPLYELSNNDYLSISEDNEYDLASN